MTAARIWILIADASRAKVLQWRGAGNDFSAVPGMAFETDHKLAHEIGADRPGRSYESVGTARHAVSPRSDPERLEEKRFTLGIIERLDTHAGEDRFDRLIVVAPPVMLGDLRAALTPRLQQRLINTLDKDLTKTPEAKLGKLLEDVLPI